MPAQAHRGTLSFCVCEWVLSGEVELWFVQTDRKVTNIFTKVLGTDKLQHFSEMLGIQHLDVARLRGRAANEPKKDPTDKGKGRVTDDVESTEEVETTRKVGTSYKGGRGRANRKKKARTKTWSDVVKGLKSKDELKTTNSDKKENEM